MVYSGNVSDMGLGCGFYLMDGSFRDSIAWIDCKVLYHEIACLGVLWGGSFAYPGALIYRRLGHL